MLIVFSDGEDVSRVKKCFIGTGVKLNFDFDLYTIITHAHFFYYAQNKKSLKPTLRP